mmetsp:Transcript_19980/g.41852  ORF Transcript_19980/g.41852 Transcript_19980/m.41852 type:complete len:477 (-) Transcript_19980:46-1476(-)
MTTKRSLKGILRRAPKSKYANLVHTTTLNLASSIHTSKIVHSSSLNSKGVVSVHDAAANAVDMQTDSVRDSLPPSLNEGGQSKQENDEVALFKSEELVLGPKLGSGEFSHVYELDSFRLESDVGVVSHEESKKRINMKGIEKYRQTNKARYAVKHIKESYISDNGPEAYIKAACDLAREAEFLANLDHPNIIKLRGLALFGAAGFINGPCGYFLVIDRLFETLNQAIKRWHHETTGQDRTSLRMLPRRLSNAIAKPRLNKITTNIKEIEDKHKMMDECLRAALQISAAMVYLHKHSIMFRDLKPENIGFDVRGDLKIFDFGLARVVPDGDNPYHNTYRMTGAGTPRYMAPECLSGGAYNLKADVYTFAIVMWEMLSGKMAYFFARDVDHLLHYVVRKCGRPEIDERWPDNIKVMLKSSFDADINTRPRMQSCCNIIKNVLASLWGGDMTGLNSSEINRRRSSLSVASFQALFPSKS